MDAPQVWELRMHVLMVMRGSIFGESVGLESLKLNEYTVYTRFSPPASSSHHAAANRTIPTAESPNPETNIKVHRKALSLWEKISLG